LRKEKNILFEEQGDDAPSALELGGSRPKAVEGGCFPPSKSLISFPKGEVEQK
jgi:hypothetical protein